MAPARTTASTVAMKVLAGRDDLVAGADAQRAEGQLHGVRAVGDADAVACTEEVGVLAPRTRRPAVRR